MSQPQIRLSVRSGSVAAVSEPSKEMHAGTQIEEAVLESQGV